MNCLHFACVDCKTYIDAGYRWAYWKLEHPGVVRCGEEISLSAVLGAAEYWNPPLREQSAWLIHEVLPAVRCYLADHRDHRIFFLEDDHFFVEDTIYQGFTEVSSDP